MNEIENIQRYIKRTGIKYKPSTPYQLNLGEMFALNHLANENKSAAICLAFEYGRAKGERSARAAKKRGAAAV